MNIKFSKTYMLVTRDNGPRIHKESTFWYALKKLMQGKGFDVVRQVPDKDGHLTSAPFYLKDRKSGEPVVHDDQHAVRNPCTPYNAGEEVYLLYFPIPEKQVTGQKK